MAGPARDDLLFLVRHARPSVDADVPPSEWGLSPEGVAGAERLANRMVGAEISVDLVVTSVERKARETGLIVADRLRCQFQTGHDLHEHRRPWAGSDDEFRAQTEAFFRSDQTAEPTDRFERALTALHRAHAGRRLVVVTHGTVMSLHLARHYRVDAWTTWQRLGMPAYVAVDRKTKTILDLVAAV